VAVNAYLSEGFQSRIEHLAALISQDQVEQAVENVATFLKEEQEFSLLDLNETQRLAGNALAAKGCFNAILAEDVGKLIYRTGCRVNRDVIIENWRQVARLSEYAPFVENIRILEESKEFEKDYQDWTDGLEIDPPDESPDLDFYNFPRESVSA
jgi:quinol monooxygenase YgiN